MKIYIEEFEPLIIFNNIKKLTHNYNLLQESYTQIISTNGIYEIYPNKIYKCIPVDLTIDPISLLKHNCVIDHSYCDDIIITQIPINNNNININKIRMTFSSKNSQFNFVITCEVYYKNNNEIHVPIDIYFESIKNTFCTDNEEPMENNVFIQDILNIIQ
jgi:hypothetical protein